MTTCIQFDRIIIFTLNSCTHKANKCPCIVQLQNIGNENYALYSDENKINAAVYKVNNGNKINVIRQTLGLWIAGVMISRIKLLGIIQIK